MNRFSPWAIEFAAHRAAALYQTGGTHADYDTHYARPRILVAGEFEIVSIGITPAQLALMDAGKDPGTLSIGYRYRP